jgi:hypothetical protein
MHTAHSAQDTDLKPDSGYPARFPTQHSNVVKSEVNNYIRFIEGFLYPYLKAIG